MLQASETQSRDGRAEKVVDFPGLVRGPEPAAAAAPAKARPSVLDGLGEPGFLEKLRSHRNLHRMSTDKLCEQNEQLAVLVGELQGELAGERAEATVLREMVDDLSASMADSERRAAEYEAAYRQADQRCTSLDAELRKAYAILDRFRQGADSFLSNAVSTFPEDVR